MDELFDRIFNKSIISNVSDIHLFLKDQLIIKMRIHGKLKYIESLDYVEGIKFLNFLKYKANINTNYRLLPQTGQFEYLYNKHIYNLRLSYLPSHDFESIVIRILNPKRNIILKKLTPFNDFNAYMLELIKNESGLITISGPTGSGKTTTLYAIIDKLIEDDDKNIITIEDPIEVKKDGCIQIQLNELQGLDYKTILKQILRHDPDIIMIGEIRDEKVARIALTCALTGHLVLTTLHAATPYLALKRLMNLGFDKLDIEDVLLSSISLKLLYDADSIPYISPCVMNKKQIQDYLDRNIIEYIDYSIKQG